MQIAKTLDSMSLDEARNKVACARTALEEMGAQLALSRTPSLARRKKCARILTEGIAVLEKLANGTLLTETIFFWVDENEDLIAEENENGDAEGYLEIQQRRSDERMTNITLSPTDVKELRLALEAEDFDRSARERKHARNLKRRVLARQPVKKNAAN